MTDFPIRSIEASRSELLRHNAEDRARRHALSQVGVAEVRQSVELARGVLDDDLMQ